MNEPADGVIAKAGYLGEGGVEVSSDREGIRRVEHTPDRERRSRGTLSNNAMAR